MYYSFMTTEEDPRIRQIWETHLAMEIEHLRLACETMKQVDATDPAEMLPQSLPEPVTFEPNKEYVRKVLGAQIDLTADGADIVHVDSLPKDHRWHQYRQQVNGGDGSQNPSETVINRERAQAGDEYRLETNGDHPVDWLRWQHAAE